MDNIAIHTKQKGETEEQHRERHKKPNTKRILNSDHHHLKFSHKMSTSQRESSPFYCLQPDENNDPVPTVASIDSLLDIINQATAEFCWCYFCCFVVPERRLCAIFGGRTMPRKVFPYLDEFLLCHVDNSCTGAKFSLSLICSFAGM